MTLVCEWCGETDFEPGFKHVLNIKGLVLMYPGVAAGNMHASCRRLWRENQERVDNREPEEV
jgi:hypothetical protein